MSNIQNDCPQHGVQAAKTLRSMHTPEDCPGAKPPRYFVYVCPDCGEQIEDSFWDPTVGKVYGHYHTPPPDWPHDEDPWVDAVEVEVVPK